MSEYDMYLLIDPRNSAIRYLGITRDDVSTRVTLHMNEHNIVGVPLTSKNDWLKDLRDNNLRPEIMIVERFEALSIGAARLIETDWIHALIDSGHQLLNTEYARQRICVVCGDSFRGHVAAITCGAECRAVRYKFVDTLQKRERRAKG